LAYLKPRAVKEYVGNNLLAGRRMELAALSIRRTELPGEKASAGGPEHQQRD
jgi:hypothetical protein